MNVLENFQETFTVEETRIIFREEEIQHRWKDTKNWSSILNFLDQFPRRTVRRWTKRWEKIFLVERIIGNHSSCIPAGLWDFDELSDRNPYRCGFDVGDRCSIYTILSELDSSDLESLASTIEDLSEIGALIEYFTLDQIVWVLEAFFRDKIEEEFEEGVENWYDIYELLTRIDENCEDGEEIGVFDGYLEDISWHEVYDWKVIALIAYFRDRGGEEKLFETLGRLPHRSMVRGRTGERTEKMLWRTLISIDADRLTKVINDLDFEDVSLMFHNMYLRNINNISKIPKLLNDLRVNNDILYYNHVLSKIIRTLKTEFGVIVLEGKTEGKGGNHIQKGSFASINEKKRLLQRFDDVEMMNGNDFEAFIAEVCRSLGYNVQNRQHTSDGGVDLIIKYRAPLTEVIVGVECKNRANSKVSRPDVQKLESAVRYQKLDQGLIISSAGFASSAISYANETGIKLIDITELRTILELSIQR